MSRPYKAFKVFLPDDRDPLATSDFDYHMTVAAREWFEKWVGGLTDKGLKFDSIRQFIRFLESQTRLDEARARDLIKRLGISLQQD